MPSPARSHAQAPAIQRRCYLRKKAQLHAIKTAPNRKERQARLIEEWAAQYLEDGRVATIEQGRKLARAAMGGGAVASVAQPEFTQEWRAAYVSGLATMRKAWYLPKSEGNEVRR